MVNGVENVLHAASTPLQSTIGGMSFSGSSQVCSLHLVQCQQGEGAYSTSIYNQRHQLFTRHSRLLKPFS